MAICYICQSKLDNFFTTSILELPNGTHVQCCLSCADRELPGSDKEEYIELDTDSPLYELKKYLYYYDLRCEQTNNYSPLMFDDPSSGICVIMFKGNLDDAKIVTEFIKTMKDYPQE